MPSSTGSGASEDRELITVEHPPQCSLGFVFIESLACCRLQKQIGWHPLDQQMP